MYCHQCGSEVSDQAKFCSGCGRTIDGATAQPAARHDMSTHIHVVAWLFIGSAIITGLFGVTLLIAPRIVELLPIPVPPDVPFDVVRLITAVSGILGTTTLLVAGATAAAGVGLLQYQTWGRPLALVMAAVMMVGIGPVGLLIGIYAFWVLLSRRGREYYDAKAAV